MSDYEDRIRRALDVRAARIDAQPEPEELTDRIAGRERRRTRALSAALVIVLFAGPTLGFVLGRGGGNDELRARRRRRAVTASRSATRARCPRSPTAATTTVPPQESSSFAAGGSGSAASDLMFAAGPSQPLARVYTRDAGGVKVRVYRADVERPGGNGPPWWEPPAVVLPERRRAGRRVQ